MNKELCRRCFKEHGLPWNRVEDEFWQHGTVYCVVDWFKAYNARGNTFIPVRCKYALEQVVMNQSHSETG